MDRLEYLRKCASAFEPALEVTPDVAKVLEPRTEALRIDGVVQPYAAYLPQRDTYTSTTIQLLEEICDSESGECLLEPGWYYGSAGDLIELYENSLCIACEKCGETSHIDQWEGYNGCPFCGYNGNVCPSCSSARTARDSGWQECRDCGQVW